MPSAYLSPSEYAAYQVPDDTTVEKVQEASTLIDGYLERPEGLVWVPDAQGLPCYMAGLSPTLSFSLPAAISPGANITVPLPAVSLGLDLLGEVFVIDRANPSLCEAVAIIGVNSPAGSVTLQRVVHAHAAGATLDLGLHILEQRQLAAKRSITRVSRSPIVRLLSGMGQYSYGRRSDQVAGLSNDVNLLAAVQTFGGPPAWLPFDATTASISVATGEIWVPAGLYMAYYSEVRLRYVAGFPAAGLPAGIKQATAAVMQSIANFGDVDGSFKVFSAGGTKLERFSDSVFSADIKARLEPYKLKLFF